jgi:hypothetical protein
LKLSGAYEYETDKNNRAKGGQGGSRSASDDRNRFSGAGGAASAGRATPRMGSIEDDLDRFMGSKNAASEDGGGFSGEGTAALSKEIKELDDWTKNGGVDPYEFVTTPQRYPHRDGADLGDNYVAGWTDKHGMYPEALSDKLALPKEAAMRQPEEFSTFFGEPSARHRPMYSRRHLKKRDINRLRKNPRLLKYARKRDAWGRRSPLSRKIRRLNYGTAAKYQRNKFGFPSDILPSTAQLHRQVDPELTNPRMRDVDAKRHDPWANPDVKQRWRKDPDCKESCAWHPVLEDKDKECEAEDCSETCQGDQCGEKVPPVRVCGPLGCEEQQPVVDKADPLKAQLSMGGLDGQADPFGAEAVLGDDREPAIAAALDLGLRSHFRANGGEPIGDSAMRGWQMHNGIDYEAKWDRDGVLDD